jgi:hypothetical protein
METINSTGWRPTSEPPKAPPNTATPVIVYVQNVNRVHSVYGAWWLDHYLMSENEDESDRILGFFEADGERWEPLEGALAWQPMPAPPGFCEHCVPDGDWCPDCNRASKEARAEAEKEQADD